MYGEHNIGQVNILGEMIPPTANNQMRHRRSVYLESAPGFQTPLNPNRVAPIQYFNQETKQQAFETNANAPNGIVYDMLKPYYVLMRVYGIFPITSIRAGFFKPTPRWFAFSLAIFLTIVSFMLYIKYFTDSAQTQSTEGRFEEAVINYLFTVYAVPIIVVPILWYESRNVAGILNEWIYLERVYNKVTKKKLSIYLGNKPLMLTIALPVLATATMVVTHITMEQRYFEIVPYSYINTVTYLAGGFWFIQCDVIGKVALHIANDFQAALKHVGPSTQVSDYRTLWMLLSKLIRNIGMASGYSITFLCLYLFMIVTLTIYGLLSQLQSGLSPKDIGLTITAVLAVCFLFFICDEAHYASNCVRVQFQKKLLMVELDWMAEDAQQEISMFLRATEMSPTDINAVGFFDVNRNLFKSLLATMVTYLVVLLQFQISIPDEIPDNTANKTMVVPNAPTLPPKQ